MVMQNRSKFRYPDSEQDMSEVLAGVVPWVSLKSNPWQGLGPTDPMTTISLEHNLAFLSLRSD